MKAPIVAIVLILLGFADARGDRIPIDPKTPLFRIYEIELLPDNGSDPHTHRANAGKVLLSVYALRDLQFLADDAVRVALNASDTKVFSQLTHTHEFMTLITGDEKGGVTMHISGPIDDGIITFTRAN